MQIRTGALCVLPYISVPINRPLVSFVCSFRKESSNGRAFPHPQSRKGDYRKGDEPNYGSVVWEFFKRTINVTDYWNGKDDVNPAKNRPFSCFFHLIDSLPHRGCYDSGVLLLTRVAMRLRGRIRSRAGPEESKQTRPQRTTESQPRQTSPDR